METSRMNRKEAYGKVKQAVIEGQAAGMTYAEVVAKHGVRLESLYSAAKRLGLPLKPSKHTK